MTRPVEITCEHQTDTTRVLGTMRGSTVSRSRESTDVPELRQGARERPMQRGYFFAIAAVQGTTSVSGWASRSTTDELTMKRWASAVMS